MKAITVRNKYPLPLKMDLVDILFDYNKFIKLDILKMYGNLRGSKGNK